jgi:glyoxylase-like metal-dependent hydrolase (beta-lactamase superfamily II)
VYSLVIPSSSVNVGRPDLAIKSDLTIEDLAELIRADSLRNKLIILPDDVIVYPAHGAGSACGKISPKKPLLPWVIRNNAIMPFNP